MNTDGSYKNVWIPTIDQLTNIPCYEYVVADTNKVFNIFSNDEPRGFRVLDINLYGSDVIISFTDYMSFSNNWNEQLSELCPVPSEADFKLFIRRL